MRLSDMFDALSDYSREMESKFAEWREQSRDWGEDAERQARAWAEDASERFKAAEKKLNEYTSGASDHAKAEWDRAEKEFGRQVDQVKATVDRTRKDWEKAGTTENADAAEAFAASMSKFALRMQNEAEKAVRMAAEARARAQGKTGGGKGDKA